MNSQARMFIRIVLLSLFSSTQLVPVEAAAAFSTTTSPSFAHSRQRLTRDHTRYSHLLKAQKDDEDKDKKSNSNPLQFLLHPYESKIPAELRDEIMKAEGQTQAAQNRNQRVALYAVFAVIGVLAAFFNGFLSELRSSTPPPEFVQSVQDSIEASGNRLQQEDFVFDIQQAGFGWVESNFITQFLFLNKIGGAVCLLGGAGAGLLAEAELDTKRINAEKIYEEMERRRAQREKKASSRTNRRSGTNEPKRRKKKNKRLSGKERKRIEALSEVVVQASEVPPAAQETPSTPEAKEPVVAVAAEKAPTMDKSEKKDKDDGGGVFGKIKGMYEKADNMAASQALLLNKKLEDAGVIDKITDETGLNVIGKEQAAAAAKKESGTESESKS